MQDMQVSQHVTAILEVAKLHPITHCYELFHGWSKIVSSSDK